MKKYNHKTIVAAVVFLILILATIYLWKYFSYFFNNPSLIREKIESYGILAPFIFIFISAVQVVFSPIPGQAAGIAGGYLFGSTLGLIYTMTGILLGSYIVFKISRTLGRPFVEKTVKKETLQKIDKLTGNKGVFVFFMIFLLPGLPDDLICYVAGLTNIKIRTLILIVLFGRLPSHLILSLTGSGLANKNSKTATVVFVILVVVSILVFLSRRKLESFSKSILKERENKPHF